MAAVNIPKLKTVGFGGSMGQNSFKYVIFLTGLVLLPRQSKGSLRLHP